MQKPLFILSASLIVLASLFFATPKAHAAGEHNKRDVVFFEIMWAGSDALPHRGNDEWFVLKNTTKNEIDLTGWQVKYFSGATPEEELMLRLLGEIPAGGYFLVSNYKTDNSILRIQPDLSLQDSGETVSLRNEYIEIRLYESESAVGTKPIDIAGDRNIRKPFGGDNGNESKNIPKKSMVRVNTGIDGNLKEAWGTMEVQCNIKYGNSELATPQSSDKDTKCHPPSVQLLNEWPKALKIGETFTTRLIVSDEGDATVSGSINNTNERWTVGETISRDIKCDVTGELKVAITVTDGKLSASRLDKILQCYDSGAVVINEVLPAPKDTDYDQSGAVDTKDEWIELHNTETRPVNLDGWQVGDKSNPQKYVLDTSAVIEPGGYLTILNSQSKISLNNDGDEVYLYDPSGRLVDKIIYGKSYDSAGWARFGTDFEWTLKPTFGGANIHSPISIEKDAVAAFNIDNAPDPPQIEIVTYKITKTRTIQPPDLELLTEVPDLSFFGQKVSEIAREQARAGRQILLEQLIIGLGGLLSLARIGYNLVYLLL